jgi:putative ABC transport system substrate-binding protein
MHCTRHFSKPADLGYVEGKNINIEYRYAEGKLIGFRPCRRNGPLKVDVIVTGDTLTIQAVKNHHHDPDCHGQRSDAVAAGLVDSLAQPGGNITA